MSQLPDSAIGEALKNHFDLTTAVLDSVDALITVTDPEGRILFFNSACEQLSGYSREEMVGKRLWDILLDSHKERLKALFNVQTAPANYTATWVTRAGEHQPIRWSCKACRSSTGIEYLLGTGTPDRQADERLLQTLTPIIAQAPDFDTAIALTLPQVCQTIGWNFAEAWIPTAGSLELHPAWYSTQELQPFRSLDVTLAPNQGVPGRVWASGQSEWTANAAQLLVRGNAAQAVGLKTAFGVPIRANGEVSAVFVFFTCDCREPDQRIVTLVEAVAVQLGLVMERWCLEAALRQSEDRFRHVIEYQTLLQRLLLDVSNHFINIDGAEVEQGISQSLQAIAEFTGSDRSYLYQVQDDTLRCLNHCCLNLWNRSNDERDQTLLISNFPWVWSHIQQLNPVSVSCINDLPTEAAAFKALCDHHKVQSVLLVPLVSRLQLFGFIGLEVVHSPKVWSEEDISSIKLVGDIFINALERQQFEQELQEQHRLLQAVVNTSTDAVFVKDLQGCYLLANQINSYIMEKPVQEIIGQDDTALFPTELAAKIQANDRKVIESGISQTFEESKLIDGELKTYLSSKSVYRDASGRAIGIIGVSKDITPQKTAQRVLEQANERLEQNVRERIAELQQVNRQLQYHLDNTPLAVIEWDQDMRIKRWSPKAAEIFGWTEAEVIGKHPQEWEIIHRDDLEMVEQAIAQFFEQEKTCYVVVNRNYTKSGAVIYCEWYNSVSFDESGKPFSVLSLIQNVTERKRAEAALKESESRLRLFIAHAPSAIAMFDAQMRYLAVSQRWMTDYGLQGDIFGRCHYEIFPDPERWREIHQRCLAGAVETCEADYFERTDGSSEWIRWAIHPWYRSETVGGIIMFTEVITERIQAQQQLQQLNQELLRSNAELEQYAFITSHDLREPLRKIKNYTDLLAESYPHDDSKANKYLNSIISGVSRMQALIADLLICSRVTRAELLLEPTDLNAVLKQVCEDLSPLIAENCAAITAQVLPTVSVHRGQMLQLFQHLIVNSIKFRGEANPIIDIQVELCSQEWLFSITDNGIGINPQYAERVFIIFQRLHNRTKYEGTGVGLTICKKIVERHGGRIWVESDVGQGAKFYWTLPVHSTHSS